MLKLLWLFWEKFAQFIWNVVGKPCAAQYLTGLHPPQRQLSDIHFDLLIKRKQQAGQTVMLERIRFLKTGALFEDTIFDQHLIDPIHPFLQITSAALDDQTFLILHTAELLNRYCLYTHSFIPPMVMPCSWAISCWVNFRKLSTPGISDRLLPLSQAAQIEPPSSTYFTVPRVPGGTA